MSGYGYHIDSTLQSALQRWLATEIRYYHLCSEHYHLHPVVIRPCHSIYPLQRSIKSLYQSLDEWHVLGNAANGADHDRRE